MAKKKRNKKQAQVRKPPPPTSKGRDHGQLIFLGAVGAIAVAALLLLTVFKSSPKPANTAGLAKTLAARGCTFKTFPSQGNKHVSSLPKGFHYSSFPPTSGPHHPQWVIWNLYDKPLPEIHLVHNLEHGGVIAQYGDNVPAGTVEKLKAWWEKDPRGLIVAPLPQLGSKIALTAWTHLATCPRFDQKAYAAFSDTLRFKGPERFPPDQLKPGT